MTTLAELASRIRVRDTYAPPIPRGEVLTGPSPYMVPITGSGPSPAQEDPLALPMPTQASRPRAAVKPRAKPAAQPAPAQEDPFALLQRRAFQSPANSAGATADPSSTIPGAWLAPEYHEKLGRPLGIRKQGMSEREGQALWGMLSPTGRLELLAHSGLPAEQLREAMPELTDEQLSAVAERQKSIAALNEQRAKEAQQKAAEREKDAEYWRKRAANR